MQTDANDFQMIIELDEQTDANDFQLIIELDEQAID